MQSKSLTVGLFAVIGLSSVSVADTTLYDQDFENPTGFVNDGADVNIFRTVNDLYGGQPAGFSFAQMFTVETLFINGTQAFGTGYDDPSGIGGNYALGMLEGEQDDLLALSFDVQEFDFLNLQMDISSIDLSSWGGPFIPPGGEAPKFRYTLYDNPSGTVGLGSGTVLDSDEATGTASAPAVFDWTHVSIPLDASLSTNGNVTLRIDLLEGEYASMDNFFIQSSDDPIPEPTSLGLFALAMIGLRRR